MMSSEINKKVYIIILNWNSKKDTLETIDSLERSTYSNYRIVVVDNASIDGSIEAIKNARPGIVLIENKENLGYAEGNNVGIRYVLEQKGDYIFILNNDTLVDKEAISILVKESEKDKKISVLGPKVYFYKERDIIQSAGGVLDSQFNPLHIGFKEQDKGQFAHYNAIDYISGCAMFVKREVFEKIGLLDPKYFMYWEETDFCFRTKKAGFKIQIVPQANIWHKGGVDPTPMITYYMARNKLLFLKKHNLGYLNIIKTCVNNVRTIVSWTIREKWKDKKTERNMLFKALIDFWLGKSGKADIQ